MQLQRRAAPFLQGNIMEFTLTIDFGFGEKVEFNTTEFWKTVAMVGFVERMEGIDDEVAEDEEDEEEYAYDEEGNAYWLDEENEVWYMYDADEDDWVEVDLEDDEDEAEDEEEEVAA
jgi:hypothetical protein